MARPEWPSDDGDGDGNGRDGSGADDVEGSDMEEATGIEDSRR